MALGETAGMILIGVGAVGVILFVGRGLVALSEGRDLEESVMMSSRFMGALVGGVVVTVSVGLMGIGETLSILTEFIASHPFAVSNFAIAGIGAVGLGGLAELGAAQFLGIALLIVGLTFVIMEVRSA